MSKNAIKPKLILNEMELKKIPTEVLQQKDLLKIKLIRNSIKNIPKDIENLSRLETFDISNNIIIHTYTKLFELQKLKILNMNNNRLINLPRQIGKLKKLRKLQLANNSLKKLPDEIEQLQDLTELNISYNKFKEFPSQIFKLKKLKSIWIGGNFFETLPIDELLKQLPNLQKIYTYSNIKFINSNNVDSNYKRLSNIQGNNFYILKQKPDDVILNQESIVVKKLTSHIIRGDLNSFFKFLNKNEELFTKEKLIDLYNLQAQWNDLQRNVNTNTISKDKEIVQKNNIVKGLLKILIEV